MRKAEKRVARRCAATVLGVATLCLLSAVGAQAADRVYWGEADKIASVGLDGAGAGELDTGGASFSFPQGKAIDPSTETVYWVNRGDAMNIGAGISFASLDGSGSGVLTIPGGVFKEPHGLAIDPVDQRIYWANRTIPSSIWVANLPDGSDAHQLSTGQAVVSGPGGLALDPVARRLYWVNDGGVLGQSTVAFAKLDEPGQGENLSTVGALENLPIGLAVDPVGQRLYWANLGGSFISFANLDGSGGGTLGTAGATVSVPEGVAVDPFGRRLYWANRDAINIGGGISFANLDGSGGGQNLITRSFKEPNFPILRTAPRATAPPEVAGGSQPRVVLSCSRGTWAPDFVESFYYDAAQSFSYQWSRNGVDLPGATESTLTPRQEGDFRCRVTAENSAGAVAQTSASHHISPPPPPPPNGAMRVTLALASPRIPAKGPIAVRVVNESAFAISGRLSAQASKPAPKSMVKLGSKAFKVAAGAKAVLRLSLPMPLRAALARTHKLSLALTATVTDPAGGRRVVRKTVVPKLRT